jgi:hypothetical protein
MRRSDQPRTSGSTARRNEARSGLGSRGSSPTTQPLRHCRNSDSHWRSRSLHKCSTSAPAASESRSPSSALCDLLLRPLEVKRPLTDARQKPRAKQRQPLRGSSRRRWGAVFRLAPQDSLRVVPDSGRPKTRVWRAPSSRCAPRRIGWHCSGERTVAQAIEVAGVVDA